MQGITGQTLELYKKAISTPKICLKTQLTKSILPFILWDPSVNEWHPSLQKTLYATWDIDAIYATGVIPPVVLLAQQLPDASVDFLIKCGKKPLLIIASRNILSYARPTLIDDLQLTNILFMEDISTMYEFISNSLSTSIPEQALVAAILLRRHVLYVPSTMQVAMEKYELNEFYKNYVGTIETYVKPPNNIVLIQQYFKHHEPIRQKEFEQCLFENIKNPFIDKIVFLVEDGVIPPIHPKILTFNIHKRLTFGDAMRWASTNLSDQTYFIIANLDIYFDDTLADIYDISMKSVCLSMLRHDIKPDGSCVMFGPRQDSQDAWIFQLPLPHSTNISGTEWDITLGYPGCDNAFAYELVQHKFMVANPAYSIKTLHLHNTSIRNYTVDNVVIRPKYIHIQPTYLNVYAQREIKDNSRIIMNAFINPVGELYDFKGKWGIVVEPPSAITRCISTNEFITVPCKQIDMQNPYMFIYNIFPRLLCGLEMHPEAECRIPDLPPLFATFLSHIKWPVETLKTIPYHPNLHIWSKKIYVAPELSAARIKENLDKSLADVYETVNVAIGPTMSNRSKHVVCTNSTAATFIRENSEGIAWNGVKTIDFTMNFMEQVKIIRSSDIIIINENEQYTHLCWMFAKNSTKVIDINSTNKFENDIKSFGFDYIWHGTELNTELVAKIHG